MGHPNSKTAPIAPLLTLAVHTTLLAARRAGRSTVRCSLDLQRSEVEVALDSRFFSYDGLEYPYMVRCRDRTAYYWTGTEFAPIARFGTALIKLVPTSWGPPTFEIDGIKMLPTARLSPISDATNKIALVQPRGKVVLDTCGGLGYFAACCLDAGATRVLSCEKNPDVIWLRGLNPWSPRSGGALELMLVDVDDFLATLSPCSVDAVLHDPPRFAIAGELYSQQFYGELARVLRPGGLLFHYTGSPNKLARGRDLAAEVSQRLIRSGFVPRVVGDGIVASRNRQRPVPDTSTHPA